MKKNKLNETILNLLLAGTPRPVELQLSNSASIDVLISLEGDELCVVANGPTGTLCAEQWPVAGEE